MQGIVRQPGGMIIQPAMVNIDNIMSYHLAWKAKLRNFLNGKGNITREEIGSHKDCKLGLWLYSDKIIKYSSIPEIAELKKSHKELHETALLIFSIISTKNKQSVKEELLKLDLLSLQVHSLLISLPKTIR